MSEKKLLPCPFCGAQLENHGPRWQHPLSGSCLLSGYGIWRDRKEIELWNTRVPMENIVKELELKQEESYKLYAIAFDPEDRGGFDAYSDAIDIVKEEGGLND